MINEVINKIHRSLKKFSINNPKGENTTVICLTLDQADAIVTALEEKCARDNQLPLTEKQLVAYANKPCYIKDLTGNNDYWRVMPEFIAKNPYPFGYGKAWLPYAYECKEVLNNG